MRWALQLLLAAAMTTTAAAAAGAADPACKQASSKTHFMAFVVPEGSTPGGAASVLHAPKVCTWMWMLVRSVGSPSGRPTMMVDVLPAAAPLPRRVSTDRSRSMPTNQPLSTTHKQVTVGREEEVSGAELQEVHWRVLGAKPRGFRQPLPQVDVFAPPRVRVGRRTPTDCIGLRTAVVVVETCVYM